MAYTNGADSTGASGSSTVVEYSPTGAVLKTIALAGYVDGLKVDPNTHQVWALQNQDGNSTLSIINPETGAVTGPLSYVDPSSTRGFDDVVFQHNAVYLSETNPPNPSGEADATIVALSGGGRSSGPLATTPVFWTGEMGLDTVTGKMEVVPQNDPDSMKTTATGDLLLTSGDDGVIIDIHHVGKPSQFITFTPIQGVPTPGAGLDDVIQTNSTSGTFFISDTGDNKVLEAHISGLNPDDYYASVASLGGFGQIDPSTGVFTLLVPVNGPHGVVFVPDHGHGHMATALTNDAHWHG